MSDSNMHGSSGLVVGTAGHIDHGKTSLVRALTGTDTDRLAEEKRRGISIDLGFAHLELPDGRSISFVDVPGHERFIKNMLAGAAGIQAIVLVVAADESVKPQTREHLDICRLLGIRHGIVLLTKSDLVTPEQLKSAREQVRALCVGSFLEGAPMLAVSAVTGQGLAELKAELSLLEERVPPRNNSGFARLPIDRSFALHGFGTVVTGTLSNGKLRVGDPVRLHPSEKDLRIRGLQVHGNNVEVTFAGQRTAVNLAGIESSEIRRGCVLTHPGPLKITRLFDVSVSWLPGFEPPRGRSNVLLHIGTAEVFATLKTLEQGSRTFARVWLSEPVLALPGDRFVLRRPSPAQTIGGGFVIDPFPPARVSRTKAINRLHKLSQVDLPARVQFLVEESSSGRRLAELAALTGVKEIDLKSIIAVSPTLTFVEAAQCTVTKAWVDQKRRKLVEWLRAYHAKNPSAAGAPIALARLGLGPSIGNVIFSEFPAVKVQRDTVALADHKARFSDQQTQVLSRIEEAFRQGGLQPPAASDLLKSLSTDPKQARALLEILIKRKSLVRLSEDLIFHADSIAHVRRSLAACRGRRFSVPEFKEWTHVSRKYAIPLLEYLDREHVTRREGDTRLVL